mmetsp:Transcript_67100/g.132300  ORF Transcript_67100/g.132300 Transcript_67100/m.132300 type:complete len:93 (+) Transcript_67100:2-280(+)
MMTMLVDASKLTKCMECKESTGYKICSRCSGTGLSQKDYKVLRKDTQFVKTTQRNLQTVLNEEGRRYLKATLSEAITAARERRAKATQTTST